MMSFLSLDVSAGALIAIVIATVVTYVWRAGGYWVMGFIKPSPRVERALAALPGSIVAALVLPAIARTGPVAIVAIVVALAMKIKYGNDILALVSGLAIAITLRASAAMLG